MKPITPTNEFYSFFEYLFDFYNRNLFDDQLKNPLIVITRKANVFGYYIHQKWKSPSNQYIDELAINPQTFFKYPLIEICQTVVHEMCHQWQYNFGNPTRVGYHNKEWAEKMIEIGLMPSSTGKEGGNIVGQKMADYVIVKGIFSIKTDLLLKEKIFNKLYCEAVFSDLRDQLIQPFENLDQLEEETNISDLNQVYQQLIISNTNTIAENPFFPSGFDSYQAAKEKKQKIKYTCPICDFNVWGKPDLKIICGECKSKYEEFTPNKQKTI
jgi:hypothetical protein